MYQFTVIVSCCAAIILVCKKMIKTDRSNSLLKDDNVCKFLCMWVCMCVVVAVGHMIAITYVIIQIYLLCLIHIRCDNKKKSEGLFEKALKHSCEVLSYCQHMCLFVDI